MGWWAYRHHPPSPSISAEDLGQVAVEALIEAARMIDYERAHDVGGYLRWKMKCACTDYMRTHGPRTRGGTRRDPIFSLDAPAPTAPESSKGAWVERLPAEPEPEERPEVDLAAALAGMSQRERTVMTRHFVEDVPWRTIAGELGVSEARVHQIREHAIEKARAALGLPAVAGAEEIVLTQRQTQVLFCTAEGLDAAETAANLHVSLETVKSYRKALILRMGAKNMYHVVALAFRRGLLI